MVVHTPHSPPHHQEQGGQVGEKIGQGNGVAVAGQPIPRKALPPLPTGNKHNRLPKKQRPKQKISLEKNQWEGLQVLVHQMDSHMICKALGLKEAADSKKSKLYRLRTSFKKRFGVGHPLTQILQLKYNLRLQVLTGFKSIEALDALYLFDMRFLMLAELQQAHRYQLKSALNLAKHQPRT